MTYDDTINSIEIAFKRASAKYLKKKIIHISLLQTNVGLGSPKRAFTLFWEIKF